MSDSLVSILYTVWFVVSFFLTAVMWWLAYRYPEARLFWGALAIGWGLNLFSSFLWGVYSVLLGAELPRLINILYVVRYVFVFAALWLYPTPWSYRRALEVLLVIAGTGLLLWLGWVGFLRAATQQSLGDLIGDGVFPILDAGILYAAWLRWRETRADPRGPVMGMLLLAMASYTVGNWIQLIVQFRTPGADSLGAVFFWLLTDLFAVLAVTYYVRSRGARQPASSG